MPSNTCSFGTVRESASANVGRKSVLWITVSLVLAAGIFPGQEITQGTRVPPSYIVALPPRKGALLVGVVLSISSYMLPPLSE